MMARMLEWRGNKLVARSVGATQGLVRMAKGLLIFLALGMVSKPANAADGNLDPLCGYGVVAGVTANKSLPAFGQLDAMLPPGLQIVTNNQDEFGILTQRLIGAELSLLNRQSTQQTVDIEPLSTVQAGKRAVVLPARPAQVKSCSKAIQFLQAMQVDIKDRSYACALLEMDRSCLTDHEPQPHVDDPTIPFRSVAIVVIKGQAVCTGILLDERSFRTARHCFINQVSGEIRSELQGLSAGDWRIETLDGMREISIDAGELKRLVVVGGFDIDQDPVTLRVGVTAQPGAKALPRVKFAMPSGSGQLLWLVGPVRFLDRAIAMSQAASDPSAPPKAPDWRKSIRWSSLVGGQCRIVEVRNSCVYHSCQSFQGFSGSPMITSVASGFGGEEDVIEYAGVHSGTPGKGKPFGWPGCTKSSADFVASDYLMFNVGKLGD